MDNGAKAIVTLTLVPVGLVALLAVGWFVRANFIVQDAALAPMEEAVRRKTFEQSKAYKQGLAQDIRSLQQDYLMADEQHKKVLRSVIVHRTADVELSELPSDLASFVAQMRGGL
jgi:hypothetical protein